jgi:hypothetical protein
MRILRPRSLCLIALAGSAFATGCYERVVAAKGMGAQGVTISQPNAPKDTVTKTTTQKRSLRLQDSSSR